MCSILHYSITTKAKSVFTWFKLSFIHTGGGLWRYSAVLIQSREHCSHEFFIGWHKIQFKCEKYLAGAKNLKGSKNLKKHNFKIKLKFKYAMLVVFWCYVAWCVVLRWGEFWWGVLLCVGCELCCVMRVEIQMNLHCWEVIGSSLPCGSASGKC